MSAGPWVVAEDAPAHPQLLDDFRFFAIIGSWMEGDVIAATVANAMAQGCERVYVVDNDSPDDTVEQAIAAGAILADRFATDQYDERVRMDRMNRVVADVSRREQDEHIWWLWIDADEFPHGPRGLTLHQSLRGLDRRFRVVGARFINHFPHGDPAYVAGFHPLEFQPLCEEHAFGFGCALGHRKHSLQRFDRRGAPIVCDRGFHVASSAERPLREPAEAIFVHHFPYREREATRRRLAMLCSKDGDGKARVRDGDDAADGMIPRFESLEAVYRGDWDRVRNYRPDTPFSVPRPVPWSSIGGEQERFPKRWYTLDELEIARRRQTAPRPLPGSAVAESINSVAASRAP